MIDLFGGEEVYNEEYEVEDCHVNRNSPMCTPYKKCERESMDEIAFLEYKRKFEAKLGISTTPHKKELKRQFVVLI
ncbi:15383_t:CDS:2, partial [Gigaspora rosea]